ncbi:MAG: hypothetical protein ABR907_04705 [Terracidiphilus sp.]|jgi:hypothetical protein
MEDIRCKFVAMEVEDSRCSARFDGAVVGVEDPRCKSLLSGAAMETGDPRCIAATKVTEDSRCRGLRYW